MVPRKPARFSSEARHVAGRVDTWAVDIDLDRARQSFADQRWRAAYDALAKVDSQAALIGSDLELLATSAFLLGDFEEYVAVLDRAHRQYVDAGELINAARCAIWIGTHRLSRGEVGPGSGWIARAQRLVDRDGRECAEQGYLLTPHMFAAFGTQDWPTGLDAAAQAIAIAQRFEDADLGALATHMQGQLLIAAGRISEGLASLDEAMVALTAGELSPIVNGIVYCGVINGCRTAHDPRRAREWTSAMSQWCAAQPDLVSFVGSCRVHRAEVLQLRGEWADALAEAMGVAEAARDAATRGDAAYVRGELHRLQGRWDAAEDAYREASSNGTEPQPGLALLRLAQGSTQAAAAMSRRAIREMSDPVRHVEILAAAVEILVTVDDRDGARGALDELQAIAGTSIGLLAAITLTAAGTYHLADDAVDRALTELRSASRLWHEISAPYEVARTRLLLGLACRELGDDESALRELQAASETFAALGAVPDLRRVDALRGAPAVPGQGLTEREIQVLRRVAAGVTNKAIASELVLSERTVDRHVSNIFAKLGVSSRAAATAYAYEQKLI
jgi:ATP/maltotriose-dependent transcriptional regulator MalT